MQKSLVLSHAAGRSVFRGSLATSKAALSAQLTMLTQAFSRDGGVVTVCPVAVAPGASFSRNQHPRSPLRGIEPHPLYAR